jgi:hypothetical protein
MFEMVVPDIPDASEKVVKTELPVTVHLLVASIVKATLVIMPFNVVLLVRLAANVVSVDATRLPVSVSPLAVKVTALESAA